MVGCSLVCLEGQTYNPPGWTWSGSDTHHMLVLCAIHYGRAHQLSRTEEESTAEQSESWAESEPGPEFFNVEDSDISVHLTLDCNFVLIFLFHNRSLIRELYMACCDGLGM